jgi:hypothetical protein
VKGFYRFTRCQQAASAVETAFLLPVILVTMMLVFEIGRMVLVIMLGNYALKSTMDDLRTYPELDFSDSAALSEIISQQMQDHAFGYLNETQLDPEVVVYSGLHEMANAGESEDEKNDEGDEANAANRPIILSTYVNIELPYVTPLPSLLLLPDTFAYRFHQVVGSFYDQS